MIRGVVKRKSKLYFTYFTDVPQPGFFKSGFFILALKDRFSTGSQPRGASLMPPDGTRFYN